MTTRVRVKFKKQQGNPYPFGEGFIADTTGVDTTTREGYLAVHNQPEGDIGVSFFYPLSLVETWEEVDTPVTPIEAPPTSEPGFFGRIFGRTE